MIPPILLSKSEEDAFESISERLAKHETEIRERRANPEYHAQIAARISHHIQEAYEAAKHLESCLKESGSVEYPPVKHVRSSLSLIATVINRVLRFGSTTKGGPR